MLLCSIMTAWAEDVTYSPVLDVNFRTNSGNTGWQTVKNATEEGNTDFELTYTAGFFAMQKYTVAEIKNATKLVITLTTGSKSGVDALKMYPIAYNDWSAETGIDNIMPLVTAATGIAPRATEGTATTPPINGAKVTGSTTQATFTITGDALAAIKSNATADGTFTLLITNDKLTDTNNKRSYLSSNSANAEAQRPTLVATIETPAVMNKTTGASYANLNAAFSALGDEDTELEVYEDQKITSRLNWENGHTLTITPKADITLKGGPGMMWFLVKNSNAVLKIGGADHKITFDGESKAMTISTQGVVQRESNGSFELNNVEFKNFDLSNTAYLCGAKNAGGTMTLQDVTITDCTSPVGGYIYDLRVANDALILKGYLNIDANSTGTAILKQANLKDSGTEGRIKVDDANFTASKVLTIDWTNLDGKDVFVEGTSVVVGVTSDAIAGRFALTNDEWVLQRKNNDLVMAKPATPTVMIGSTGYADLATALAAAQDGDVLTLLADQELKVRQNIKDMAITIKGEGKTIKRAATYNDGLIFLTAAATAETGKAASLTLENVVLDGANVESSAAFIEASNKGTTTLKDVTIRNISGSAQAAVVNKGGGKLILAGNIAMPSLFIGKPLVVTATDAVIAEPITLTTDNDTPYGLIVEDGQAKDFTCAAFRLSQQQDGLYLMPLPVANSYSHPALLHTSADIEAVKARLATEQLAQDAYTRLEAQSAGAAAGAVEYLKRMDQTNWESKYDDYSNYTRAATDAKLAYQLALRYQLKGATSAADAAVVILNDWATTNKGFLRLKQNDKGVEYNNHIPDPNEYLMTIQAYQFANAAELLRGYTGWTAADQTKFQQWIKQTFADVAILFLENHHGNNNALHYWMNWDLAALNALLSVGVLTDDKALVDYALNYTTEGTGTGTTTHAIVATHTDSETGETLAQCQESGRDQGHATLDVTLLGVLCQTAQNANVGKDLFTAYNALEMAEYVGKYNLKNAAGEFVYGDVPFTEYSNGEVTHSAISDAARGTERNSWELFHAYAKKNDKADAYTEAWVKYLRNKNAWGEAESTTNDELGYGSLMFGAEISTGIKNLMPALSEGEGVYYDLQGRRVLYPTKGVYIINGKKVVIR